MWQNIFDDCLERSALELEAELVLDVDHVLEQPSGFAARPLGRLSDLREIGARGTGSDKHDELLLSHSLVDVGDGFVNVDVCDVTHLDRPEAFMSKNRRRPRSSPRLK